MRASGFFGRKLFKQIHFDVNLVHLNELNYKMPMSESEQMTDNSERIRRLAQDLVKRGLGTAISKLKSGQVASREISQLNITGPGRMELLSNDLPDWSLASFHILTELEKTQDFEDFKSLVEQDKQFAPKMNTLIGTNRSRRRMTCSELLRIYFHRVLTHAPSTLVVPDSQLNEIWNNTVLLLLADKVKVKFWCFLERVQSPNETKELLPNVFLKGLSYAELEKLWFNNSLIQSYFPFYGYSTSTIFDAQTIIETKVEEEVVIGEQDSGIEQALKSFQVIHECFESIVTSIRLIKPEPVILSPIMIEVNDFWGSSSAHGFRQVLNRPHEKPCELQSKNIDEVIEILKILNAPNSQQNRRLNICIRRLGFANTRISYEDRLLDTTMALESLVLEDSGDPKERGELSFRMSLRIAKFTESKPAIQREVFEFVRSAYKLRSKVIHGDELKLEDETIVKELESLAKKVTRKYLHDLATGNAIDWNSLLF